VKTYFDLEIAAECCLHNLAFLFAILQWLLDNPYKFYFVTQKGNKNSSDDKLIDGLTCF